jgi:hypothetical protein
VPVGGTRLVGQTTSCGSGAAGVISRIRIRMTRANSKKRAGADGPTELAFVQMIMLTEVLSHRSVKRAC